MKIQVLGVGCPKCKMLMESVQIAVKELGIQAEIEKVTELSEIVGFGVMTTPGLVVDGKVVSAGKVLNVNDVKQFLSKA